MTIDLDSTLDYTKIEPIIRSILITNAQNGATVEEIREQFYELTGENIPYIEDMTEFLLKIKGIMCYVNPNGTRIFSLVASEKSQHILSMVHNQKPKHSNNINYYQRSHQPRLRRNSVNETDCSNSETNLNHVCYFKNNYQYNAMFRQKNQNFSDKMNSSWNSRQTGTSAGYWNSNYEQDFYENLFRQKGIAHLYDYQLMGDDFFLSMAKMELGCRIKKDEKASRSGLCISGLTIRKATKLVNTLPYICPNIIVNIGSVDILNGRDLIDIEYDFRSLKRAFANRGITPIFTTLAPLGNFGHKLERHIVERFNDFIQRNMDLYVIDLWPCMVNQNRNTLYECYQTSARYVTGSNKPHVLWNKLGRQRILKKIKSEIELLPF